MRVAQARDYNVTSAGISAEEDRHHRMKVYFIMMSIRMACVASLLFLRGWWILVAIIGGVFLPYVAVLLANQPRYSAQEQPEQPEPLQLTQGTVAVDRKDPQHPIIIIDEPASRRRTGEPPQGSASHPSETKPDDPADGESTS